MLDRKDNKNADIGRFELAYKDNPHPGFKCVDNKFYVEGARIRKADLIKYSELDKRIKNKDKEKARKKKLRDEEIAKNGGVIDMSMKVKKEEDKEGKEDEKKGEKKGKEKEETEESWVTGIPHQP